MGNMFRTNIRIEHELAERAKEVAKKEKRSLNTIIVLAIEEYLRKEGEDVKQD